MENSTTLISRQGVTSMKTEADDTKGKLILTNRHRLENKLRPAHTIEFDDIAGIEFMMKMLAQLRGKMLAAGLPKVTSNETVEMEIRILSVGGKPAAIVVRDIKNGKKSNLHEILKDEDGDENIPFIIELLKKEGIL